MKKITVIGSLNTDLVIETPKIPSIGETVLGHHFMTVCGGKGANQAVAASRLGADITMIGCVGDDIFGDTLIKNLNANKVNTTHIKVLKEYPSGVAMITVKDGDNSIIVSPGANFGLMPKDIANLEKEICKAEIVIIQLEIPMDTVIKACELAHENNVKVLLNPAPATRLSKELLSKVDILTPNESEAEIITGVSVKNIEDAKKAVSELCKTGIPNVLITIGGKGVIYNQGTRILHKTVPMVNVVDTTAAGDAFTAAIAVAISEGMNIDAAVDFANAAGTLTVMKKGAQTSLPYRNEVEELYTNMIC